MYKRSTIIAHCRPHGESGALWPVFLTVAWDGKKLSMTGVEGPKGNGDAHGSCGQIAMHEWADYIAAPGIDLARIRAIWDAWHLNDMKPGCLHQRAEGWGEGERIEVVTYKLTREALSEAGAVMRDAQARLLKGETVALSADARALAALPYTRTAAPDADGPEAGRYEVDKRDLKYPGHTYPTEHPKGVLGKPCPVCGYKYGTAWLHEDVPADVIAFLQSLPDDGERMPARWRH
jgi:hypothetical protein